MWTVFFLNKLHMEWTLFCILTVQSPVSKIKLVFITEVNGIQNYKVVNWGVIRPPYAHSQISHSRWIPCMRENLCWLHFVNSVFLAWTVKWALIKIIATFKKFWKCQLLQIVGRHLSANLFIGQSSQNLRLHMEISLCICK